MPYYSYLRLDPSKDILSRLSREAELFSRTRNDSDIKTYQDPVWAQSHDLRFVASELTLTLQLAICHSTLIRREAWSWIYLDIDDPEPFCLEIRIPLPEDTAKFKEMVRATRAVQDKYPESFLLLKEVFYQLAESIDNFFKEPLDDGSVCQTA